MSKTPDIKKFLDHGRLFSALQPKGLSGNDPGKLIIKRRTQFTSWQRKELETIFSQSQYISPKIRQSLSQKLGTSQEVILVR